MAEMIKQSVPTDIVQHYYHPVKANLSRYRYLKTPLYNNTSTSITLSPTSSTSI